MRAYSGPPATQSHHFNQTKFHSPVHLSSVRYISSKCTVCVRTSCELRIKAREHENATGFLPETSDLDLQQSSLRKVHWYPGHIAAAEKQLKEQLRVVDVILEVRDARIPAASCHSLIPQWCGRKPIILVLNREDMVSEQDKAAWTLHFRKKKKVVYWTNGVSGDGVLQVAKAAAAAGQEINAKRKQRGLQPRKVRACVIGFPNVGKSALINRLLKRRVCESAPKPGVTRTLQWVKVGSNLDLLDAPGVIPMSFKDQQAANLLAMCNDIGEASYLDSQVAANLLQIFKNHPASESIQQRLVKRYNLSQCMGATGESFICELAELQFNGDIERAGIRLLNDFRTGTLGSLALQHPNVNFFSV